MQQDHLRRLSIFVDEPDPDQFYWVLHESTEDAAVWLDVSESEKSYLTWIDTFDRGTVERMKQRRNKLMAPRTNREDESVSSVG